mmetsp:Transcript_25469/g.42361  ORF Transcript_25469/g.42361 Transcript_25469/m.42361 type:complete len:279 (+) Transcript_25469:302-1138(+)
MEAPDKNKFVDIKTRQELANRLKCDTKALEYAVLKAPPANCKKKDCPYPSIERNQGLCVCCGLYWFPSKRTTRRGKELVSRGHLLLGPEFLSSKLHACDCNNEICVGVGYTADMFAFPCDATTRSQWYAAMGNHLLPVTKQQIDRKPRNFKLAHWHFHPCHLERNGNGRRAFRKEVTYKDEENKVWKTPNHPPPNCLPGRFKDYIEAEKEPQPQDRWLFEQTLPVWIKSMRRCEQIDRRAKQPEGNKRAKINVSPMEHRAVAAVHEKAELEARVTTLL